MNKEHARWPAFDTDQLELKPLTHRRHDLDLSIIQRLRPAKSVHKNLKIVAQSIIDARNADAPVVFMFGAHVIRSGMQRYIIDLIERGYISCIATNGAGVIHDYEFALIGATTESVADYIRDGRFGFWNETGEINNIVSQGAKADLGLGEAVGKAIAEGDFPYRDISILAAGYGLGIPITVHVGIGYDITHQHPNCDGAAYGKTSYTDFLRFAEMLRRLEGGVVMNFGSAIMAPEVFLKALSMARNIARQQGNSIHNFTTLVCDLYPLPENYTSEAPKESPAYYFRPWKTMLIRSVNEGGKSYYVKGHHAETIPALWTVIQQLDG